MLSEVLIMRGDVHGTTQSEGRRVCSRGYPQQQVAQGRFLPPSPSTLAAAHFQQLSQATTFSAYVLIWEIIQEKSWQSTALLSILPSTLFLHLLRCEIRRSNQNEDNRMFYSSLPRPTLYNIQL